MEIPLPDFLFVSSKELPGGEMILHTKKPFVIARALKFETEESLKNFLIKHDLNGHCVVFQNYRIAICLVGHFNLPINDPVISGPIIEEFTSPLQQMATFYEKERIQGNESRLKKYAR